MDLPEARVEVALSTAPLTRPAEEDWTRIDVVDPADDASPLISASTSYGTRALTGELEPATGTIRLKDPTSALQPANTAGPWYPDLKLRRRLRVVLEPDGDTDRPFCGGFISKIEPHWELGHGEATIELVDLFTVIAPVELPPSVLDLAIRDSLPTHYWPLVEDVGDQVDDVVGNADGRYLASVGSGEQILPWDPRTAQRFSTASEPATSTAQPQQRVTTGVVTIPDEFTFVTWVQFPTPIPVASPLWPSFALLASGYYNQNNGIEIRITAGNAEPPGITVLAVTTPTTFIALSHWGTARPQLDDGQAHMVAIAVSATTPGDCGIWIDNIPTTISYQEFGAVSTFSGIPPRPFIINGATNGGAACDCHVAHAVWYDRILDQTEIDTLHTAATAPWDGDTTGQRLARICDLAGIDADDRDIDTGIAICGPALLERQPAVDYMRKIVATEGGALYQSPDIKLTFRARPLNDPTSEVTYAGNPDDGIPYQDITPDYSDARTINKAQATRPDGLPLTVENPTSIDEYGLLDTSVDTVARSAGGARTIAQRLVFRSGTPRTVISDIDLNGRDPNMTLDATVDRRPLDAVTVLAQLPGYTLDQLSLIDHLEHTIDWAQQTWATAVAVGDVVVFPFMKFDTAGRGFDRSVWGA